MRLLLIRHAESTANVGDVIDTTTPGPTLTDLGREQAAGLPDRLVDEKVGAVFVSTMRRTPMTAAPVLAAWELEADERAGIREVEAGDLEGLAVSAAADDYWMSFVAWSQGDLDVRIPGGESGQEVLDRFDAVVREAEALGHDTVALVTHGGVIRVWAPWAAANIDAAYGMRHTVHNTAVVVLEGSSDDGWTLVSWDGSAPEPQEEPA